MRYIATSAPRDTTSSVRVRFICLRVFFIAIGAIVIVRLFFLQIWSGKAYQLLATNQHELQAKLVPQRGRILVRDRADGGLYPLATNRDAWNMYAEPRHMKDIPLVAREIAPLLTALPGMASTTDATLITKWTAKPDDAYEPIIKNLTNEQADVIKEKNSTASAL